MPKNEQDFRGVSLKRELVDEVEEYVQKSTRYKSIADFIHEAIRLKMQDLEKCSLPRFEHFNRGPDGVRITDREQHRIADIYFKPEGMFCDLDKSNSCVHIDFALTVSDIQEIIRKHRKEGWKLPDV